MASDPIRQAVEAHIESRSPGGASGWGGSTLYLRHDIGEPTPRARLADALEEAYRDIAARVIELQKRGNGRTPGTPAKP